MTINETKTALVTGNTFQVKDKLKSAGWQWVPAAKGWSKDVPASYTEKMAEQSIRDIGGIRNRLGKVAITFISK